MLLPFLTDNLGIGALYAGMIVLLPKAWDVILNPLAGRISDRTVDPRGPRRPWLLRGGLSLAVAFALLFAGPSLGPGLDAAWVRSEEHTSELQSLMLISYAAYCCKKKT